MTSLKALCPNTVTLGQHRNLGLGRGGGDPIQSMAVVLVKGSMGPREQRERNNKSNKQPENEIFFFQAWKGEEKGEGSHLGEALLHQKEQFRGSRAAVDTAAEAPVGKPWLCST